MLEASLQMKCEAVIRALHAVDHWSLVLFRATAYVELDRTRLKQTVS
jgi:hypothetical protein